MTQSCVVPEKMALIRQTLAPIGHEYNILYNKKQPLT